ncbi:MAG: hypothetical protein OEW16_03035 [Gammaproteobacteria bacterium]|nr:hypothetical protein [Gammaproteobacteria bacterium]
MRGPYLAAVLLLALATIPCQSEELPVRKALSSGTCHEASSPNYRHIEAYVAYATLAECLDSGGKLRKGSVVSPPSPPKQNGKDLYDSDDPNIIKKSRNNICYDSSDGRFTGINHYTAYANMSDCLAEGGRLPSD